MTKKTEEKTEMTTGESLFLPSKAEDAALPSFMKGDVEGTEELGQFIRPPRLKIVQKNANEELLKLFDPGDLILIPQNVVVAPVEKAENGRPTGSGTPFAFIPVLFYPEWIVVNPIAYKGSEPFIRERTTDPHSEIALKSKSPETWREPHPTRPTDDAGNQAFIRYVECLNFIVYILGVPGLEGLPVVLSFSKTQHRKGTNLAMLIKMRRAPIYGCIFEAWVTSESNAQGSWFGYTIQNPSKTGFSQFVKNEQDYAFLKEKHEELKSARIEINYDDEDMSDSSAGLGGDDKF